MSKEETEKMMYICEGAGRETGKVLEALVGKNGEREVEERGR